MTEDRKIIVRCTPGGHRYIELMRLLHRDAYVFDISDDHNDALYKRRLVFEFASWLSEQNFTNPDVSVSEWVTTFFNQKDQTTIEQ